jgi:hypothetical protein
MKQTAVDLMYERAISVLPMGSIDARQRLKETYQQAKEMEKEQIMDAHNNGYGSGYMDEGISPEKFYNETYGGEK